MAIQIPRHFHCICVLVFLSNAALLTASLHGAAPPNQNGNELPSEKQLPGDHRSVQEPTGASSLPSENALPGNETPRGLPSDDPQPTAPAIPPESMLPGQSVTQPDEPKVTAPDKPDAANADGGNRVAENPGADQFDENALGEDRPILRLNYDAPTGQLRCLELSPDGRRMISGGEGKDVQVWIRDPREATRWVHQRTIRWQVWRGPRGAIHDAAFTRNANGNALVAIAGYGAMGGTGEIWVCGADDGKRVRTLVDYDNAHRQAIDQLAWSSDAAQLASADLSGALVVWRPDPTTGIWKPKRWVDDDAATFGPEIADALKRDWRGDHPIVWSSDHIIHPEFVEFKEQEFVYPTWNLVSRSSIDGSPQTLTTEPIAGLLKDLWISEDGKILAASCFSERRIRLYRFDDSGRWASWKTIQLEGNPLWSVLDARATRLLVATEAKAGDTPRSASIACFRLSDSTTKPVSQITLPENSLAGRFDESSSSIVIAVGPRIQTHPIDDQGRITENASQTLRAPLLPILELVVGKEASPLRVGISRSRDANGDKAITEVFNLDRNTLRQDAVAPADDFLPSQRLQKNWTIAARLDAINKFDWFVDDQKIGPFSLRPDRHGRPTTISTYQGNSNDGDRDGDRLIVGTDGQNGVYVFEVPDPQRKPVEPPKLLRWFRGHTAPVRSTSVTADGRYLFSGGDDGLVFIWNLQNAGDDPRIDRWGATLDTAGVVETIDPAGPLYFRGVRVGDQLTRLQWPDHLGKTQTSAAAEGMLATLAGVSVDTQVVFDFSRQGQPVGQFQMFPAWYPMATLLIDQRRQWAIWTPAGIYNASVTGNRRFGWQVNRGLDEDVDFFTADQFEKTLERPDVMRRLFSAGSLTEAIRQTIGGTAPPDTSAIVNQIRSRPTIRIVTPQPNQTLPDDSMDVRVNVTVPPGHALAGVKAYVDGIPGQETARTPNPSGELEIAWTFVLPHQSRMKLKIIAVTDGGTAAEQTIGLRRDLAQRPADQIDKPQLHVLAVGVGRYRDSNIVSLDFPASATTEIADLFRENASSLYDVTTEQLINSQGTRSLFRIYAEAAVEQLRERVGPDDVVILYLCGHGLKDRRTQKWYFVTADASYRDLMDDQYSDCISMDDLAAFSSLPCRKIAILDSCHSGAIQTSMRSDDLKSALRLLQNDQVITLTASEGDEEAAEVVEEGLGRFTSRLIEGLKGAADRNQDGRVTIGETVDFVSITVAQDARRDAMSQHPTASPIDLIERIDLPLTRVGAHSQ